MASAYRRTFFIHITRDVAGKSSRRFVSKGEAARLKSAGENIEERAGKRWYVRYRDAAGGWHDERTTARTKADALRIALDLERKAERQRQGLEPLPGDAKMTLGELCDWWLREKCPPGSLVSETSRLRLHLKDHALGRLTLVRVTAVKVEERLREMERDGLGPNSINHLRRVLLGIFRRATKAGLWYGPNPIEAVETRREHERAYATLKPHEVPIFLAHVPPQWRDVFATALYLGLRKGELFALKKSDIDLRSRIATIQRSYLRATTKGGHVDTLPIAPQLVPYLEHAMAASGSEYMFPGPDGGMRSKDNDLARLTQVVCKRAGLVEGYDHSCRRCKRKGKPYVERRPDIAKRHCPQCGMQLWVTAIPRPMRFHDTRHTYGTLLAQGGFDGVRLQRAMRHRDFKMTARYVHTNVEDLRGVGACLPPAALGPVPPPAAAPAPPPPEPPFDSAPLRGATLRANGSGESARSSTAAPLGPTDLAAAPTAGLLQVSGKGKKKGPGRLKNSQENPAPVLARPRGFEPLAFGFVVRRSIQLS